MLMQVEAVLLFLGELGGGEILMILVVVLLLFGAKRIPDFARSLGSGIREFKDAVQGMRNELEGSVQDEEPPVRPPTPTDPDQAKTPPLMPPAPGSDLKSTPVSGYPYTHDDTD
jgi:sec-independent protein translocase protein TatA